MIPHRLSHTCFAIVLALAPVAAQCCCPDQWQAPGSCCEEEANHNAERSCLSCLEESKANDLVLASTNQLFLDALDSAAFAPAVLQNQFALKNETDVSERAVFRISEIPLKPRAPPIMAA